MAGRTGRVGQRTGGRGVVTSLVSGAAAAATLRALVEEELGRPLLVEEEALAPALARRAAGGDGGDVQAPPETFAIADAGGVDDVRRRLEDGLAMLEAPD